MRFQTNFENEKSREAEANIKAVHEWNFDNSRKYGSLPPLHPYIKMDVNVGVGCNEPDYGYIIVRVLNSYNIKDALKENGYKYGDKNWYKLFPNFEEAKIEAIRLQSFCK